MESSSNFYFGPYCYPATVSVSLTPSVIQASETDSTFISDYVPQKNPVIAVNKYTFFSLSNATNTASIVIAATSPTGISKGIGMTSFGAFSQIRRVLKVLLATNR